MFRLVEDRAEKISAQETFANGLRRAWINHENRLIVWRPDSRSLDISHNGSFWFASTELDGSESTPRYWNSIGKYQANGGLQITVEINIPTESNSERVSGFFARDEQTDIVYMLHDGGIGGGRKGIGRESFLAWSGEKTVPVQDSKGGVRHGILITPIQSEDIGIRVARFALTVANFKQAVAKGETDNTPQQESVQTYKDYFREFSGTKKGQRKQEIEYISRHGEIVDALSAWRKKHISPKGNASERIVKNIYIDLGIADASDNLTELYEVKPIVERQSLYTAIGQIMVHDNGSFKNLQRFIVLPDSNDIPLDVMHTLIRLNIKILRFVLTRDSVRIVE
jgi:hypothetical protein